MTAELLSPNRARSYALVAGLSMILSAIFASITFNFFGYPTSFLLLPIIILFLWPRGADSNISYILIFFCGLTLDLFTGAKLGGWSLIFLPVFVVMRPFQLGKDAGLAETWANFLLWMGMLVALFLITGRIGPVKTDMFSLFILGLVTVLIFPLIYGFRYMLRDYLIDEDEM